MLKFDPNIPVYLQIMEFLKKKIASGKLQPGEKLPSVREMAQMFGVNPNTVQRVIQELERENLIFTERGIGNFVTKNEKVISKMREEMAAKMIEDFISSMNEIGFSNGEIMQLIKKKIEEER
ncbi:GntR family transcriptional regulator [Caldicellulosiruptor morganii]|uniref:GntR family transcriptional regulator n=1 Tax=Caldicellulosiruptor morganii TaxID=1387555 RepID=A0ABY7BQX9_9FIRM|nr:GntR family transcriptional regulator [Caldicellulosiruptor morganii]WAM33951.1 GntR family transcriptional regulator [Caldicellulosiruptor morganii]